MPIYPIGIGTLERLELSPRPIVYRDAIYRVLETIILETVIRYDRYTRSLALPDKVYRDRYFILAL